MKYAKGTFIYTLISSFFSLIILLFFSGFEQEIKLTWDVVLTVLFITNSISIISLVVYESKPANR